MKAVLKFQLPEETREFECASKSLELVLALWDMDQYLRNKMKYESENMSEEVYKTHEEIRSHLINLMEERGLNFDFLMH